MSHLPTGPWPSVPDENNGKGKKPDREEEVKEKVPEPKNKKGKKTTKKTDSEKEDEGSEEEVGIEAEESRKVDEGSPSASRREKGKDNDFGLAVGAVDASVSDPELVVSFKINMNGLNSLNWTTPAWIDHRTPKDESDGEDEDDRENQTDPSHDDTFALVDTRDETTLPLDFSISVSARAAAKLAELKEKFGLAKMYSGSVARLEEPAGFTTIDVLCVFLGPSAASNTSSSNWNAFKVANGQYTHSLQELEKNFQKEGFSLNQCFLVDAFPLLLWGDKTQTITSSTYFSHFPLGVQYIRFVLQSVKPKYVLTFGSPSCYVVDVASGQREETSVMKSHFSTNGKYQFGTKRVEHSGTVYYFCQHPGAWSDGHFNLPRDACKEIKLAKK